MVCVYVGPVPDKVKVEKKSPLIGEAPSDEMQALFRPHATRVSPLDRAEHLQEFLICSVVVFA